MLRKKSGRYHIANIIANKANTRIRSVMITEKTDTFERVSVYTQHTYHTIDNVKFYNCNKFFSVGLVDMYVDK